MSSHIYTSPSGDGEQQTKKLITLHLVKEMTGVGSSYIYKEIAEDRFPKPVKLGTKASRWISAEIQNWIDARIADRDGAK